MKTGFYKDRPENTFELSNTGKTVTLWDVFSSAVDMATTGLCNNIYQQEILPINKNYSVLCKAKYVINKVIGCIAIIRKGNISPTNAIARVDFKVKDFGFIGQEEYYCEKFKELYAKFKAKKGEELVLTILDKFEEPNAEIISNTE